MLVEVAEHEDGRQVEQRRRSRAADGIRRRAVGSVGGVVGPVSMPVAAAVSLHADICVVAGSPDEGRVAGGALTRSTAVAVASEQRLSSRNEPRISEVRRVVLCHAQQLLK